MSTEESKNVQKIVDPLASGFSCATPLSVEFQEGPRPRDNPMIFADEGAVITSNLKKRKDNPEISFEHHDLIDGCQIQFTYSDQSYYIEDQTVRLSMKPFNPTSALALVLQNRSMREVFQLEKGTIFCIGNRLVVKVTKLGVKRTKAIWDSRADDLVTSSDNLDNFRSSVNFLDQQAPSVASTIPQRVINKSEKKPSTEQPRIRSLRFASGIGPSVNNPMSSSLPSSSSPISSSLLSSSPLSSSPSLSSLSSSPPSVPSLPSLPSEKHHGRTTSILKTSGSAIERRRHTKSVGFHVPTKENDTSIIKEHLQIVDEIIEANNIELTILEILGKEEDDSDDEEGKESLVGKTFTLDGDGVISFGSSSSSTIQLSNKYNQSSEAKIRMFGSQYYLFIGRSNNTKSMIYVGQNNCKFQIRPGDIYQYGLGDGQDRDDDQRERDDKDDKDDKDVKGVKGDKDDTNQHSSCIRFTTVLAFDASPNEQVVCVLNNKKFNIPYSFRLMKSECSIGTKRDQNDIDVSIRDIKMASLHATIRKWKTTYYLDPESECRNTYHCIGNFKFCRGPCPLDVNDIFLIGKNEFIVKSILNVDQDINSIDQESVSGSSSRSTDGEFRSSKKRSSCIDIDEAEDGNGKGNAPISIISNKRLSRNLSNEEVSNNQWSTRFSTLSIDGTCSTQQMNEQWFGYRGNQSTVGDGGGDLFNCSNQHQTLFGGAFIESPSMKNVPKSKLNFPRISFEVLKGPIRGEIFTIASGIATIGRHPQNMIVLPDRSVNSIHASISYNNAKFYLTDMNSLTGTYTKVQVDDGVALERGDTFLMGGTEMTVYTKNNDGNQLRNGGSCCVLS